MRAARDAVRALPVHEAPARVLGRRLARGVVAAEDATSDDPAPVVPITEARSRRRLAWIAASVAAAAAVVVVIVLRTAARCRPT